MRGHFCLVGPVENVHNSRSFVIVTVSRSLMPEFLRTPSFPPALPYNSQWHHSLQNLANITGQSAARWQLPLSTHIWICYKQAGVCRHWNDCIRVSNVAILSHRMEALQADFIIMPLDNCMLHWQSNGVCRNLVLPAVRMKTPIYTTLLKLNHYKPVLTWENALI